MSEFTTDEKIEILNDWLELGKRSFPYEHSGYFTEGKAALLLKDMLESPLAAEKELELLREYTSYVAMARDDEYEPLEYDSWKETNYPSL